MLSILNNISDRIWIPNQTALEFHNNRLSAIADQLKAYDDIHSKINEMQDEIRVTLHRNRHPFIKNSDKLLGDVREIFLNIVAELETRKDKYSLLMFYCNWALHIKISKASSIRAVKTFLDGAENNDDKALAFFNFESLKEELKIFLIDFSLPKEIVENNMKWGDFTNLLREILLDTPIITPTDSIEKFSFKRSFRGILAKPNIYWSIEYTENDHDYKKPIIDL